jgi:hypothetical protein
MKTYLIKCIFRLLLTPLFGIALLVPSCSSEGGPCHKAISRDFPIDKPFTRISSSSNFAIEIRQNKHFKHCTLKATGCESDLSDLKLAIKDGILDIRFTKYRALRYYVEISITTPVAAEVQFFKTPRIRMEKQTDSCNL